MKNYLYLIDRNTKGRCDVTPLFSHFDGFNDLVNDLVDQVPTTGVDIVACIDALGFILGTAISQKLNVGILTIRKGGKLPVSTDSIDFTDYTGLNKQLEIRQDVLVEGMRVLIVDEWIETGAQISASIQLIENRGASVVGIVTISMDDNENTQKIRSNYRVITTWDDGT
ncbi:MAG: phosphoribosyltransferase family protein [Anaerolineales bacterium]|jgi:adenine phosphoribosyltransferase